MLTVFKSRLVTNRHLPGHMEQGPNNIKERKQLRTKHTSFLQYIIRQSWKQRVNGPSYGWKGWARRPSSCPARFRSYLSRCKGRSRRRLNGGAKAINGNIEKPHRRLKPPTRDHSSLSNFPMQVHSTVHRRMPAKSHIIQARNPSSSTVTLIHVLCTPPFPGSSNFSAPLCPALLHRAPLHPLSTTLPLQFVAWIYRNISPPVGLRHICSVP